MYKLPYKLESVEGKHTVCDELDPNKFDELIGKYSLVEVYAKVGSGKNFWANQLAYLQDEDGRELNILYITSRQATANAEAKKLGVNRYIDFDKIKDNGIGVVPGFRAYCTNAGLAKWLGKHSVDDIKKLSEYLDLIIMDEAHSLSTDATFTVSPFYVFNFLKFAHSVNSSLTTVLMTGTPHPINWLMQWDLSRDAKKHIEYDLRECCTHVKTENIYFISKDTTEKKLAKLYKEGIKFMYFVDSITRLQELWNTLITKYNVKPNEIAVGFSDDEREGEFDPALPDAQRNGVKDYLAEHEELREDIKMFITTIKNKEGININNKDYNIMFAESFWDDEITQMAGRIRNGIKDLYIVSGFNYRTSDDNLYVDIVSSTKFLPYANKVLAEMKEEYEFLFPERVAIFTSQVDSRYDFFKYDKLNTKDFQWYTGHDMGILHRNVSTRYFRTALKYWNEKKVVQYEWILPDYAEQYWITGQEYFAQVFPESKIHDHSIDAVELVETEEERRDVIYIAAIEAFNEKGWLEVDLNENLKSDVLDVANRLVGKYFKHKKYTSLKSALKALGLGYTTIGTKSGYISKKTGESTAGFRILREK